MLCIKPIINANCSVNLSKSIFIFVMQFYLHWWCMYIVCFASHTLISKQKAIFWATLYFEQSQSSATWHFISMEYSCHKYIQELVNFDDVWQLSMLFSYQVNSNYSFATTIFIKSLGWTMTHIIIRVRVGTGLRFEQLSAGIMSWLNDSKSLWILELKTVIGQHK